MKRAICTIITRNYLSYARTLAETLYQHNPDYQLYVLCIEPIEGAFNPQQEPFHCLTLEDLSDIDTIGKMCFYYTSFELCNGLRGFLHEYMFNKTSYNNWLYLDADIAVYASLEPIFTQIEKTSILLIPHSQSPTLQDYVELYEVNHIVEGVYNSGFLGLNRTQTTQKFIAWFKDRLIKYAFDDRSYGIPRALFGDQPWLNLAPLYFDTRLFKSAGANLAHWNLYRSHLTRDQKGISVNHDPLLFIHFSGFEIDNPEQVSKYSPIYNQENTPSIWIELAQDYQLMLHKHGYSETINIPYKHNYFVNNKEISFKMRRMYYEALSQNTYLEAPFHSHDFFVKRLKKQRLKTLFRICNSLLLRKRLSE